MEHAIEGALFDVLVPELPEEGFLEEIYLRVAQAGGTHTEVRFEPETYCESDGRRLMPSEIKRWFRQHSGSLVRIRVSGSIRHFQPVNGHANAFMQANGTAIRWYYKVKAMRISLIGPVTPTEIGVTTPGN